MAVSLTVAAWSGVVPGGAVAAGAAWTDASSCPTAWPPLQGRSPGISADDGDEHTAFRGGTQGRSECKCDALVRHCSRPAHAAVPPLESLLAECCERSAQVGIWSPFVLQIASGHTAYRLESILCVENAMR